MTPTDTPSCPTCGYGTLDCSEAAVAQRMADKEAAKIRCARCHTNQIIWNVRDIDNMEPYCRVDLACGHTTLGVRSGR